MGDSFMDSKNGHVLLILVQVLLSVMALILMISRSSSMSLIVFWIVLWILIVTTFIVTDRLARPWKLASLAILALTISGIHLASLPEPQQLGPDVFFEAQTAALIVETGLWDPESGVGFAENYYGYNPTLHMTTAYLSLTTGTDSFYLAKYSLFLLLRLMLVGFAFLVLDELFGKEREHLTYFATLLFIGSAGLSFIGVSRRTMAGIFVLLSLYVLIKHIKDPHTIRWPLLFGLFAAMVVISDHSVSYFFLLFLMGLGLSSLLWNVIPLLRQKVRIPSIFFHFLYFLIGLFTWDFYISKVLFENDMVYIRSISNLIFSGFSQGTGTKAITDSLPLVYRFYELITISAAQLLFLLIGGLGLIFFLYRFLRRLKSQAPMDVSTPFLLYFILFGFLMFLISEAFIITNTSVAGTVLLWFFGIPLCILVAMVLSGTIRSKIPLPLYLTISSIFLILLFTGSLFMGIYTPRVTNRIGEEGIIYEDDLRVKTGQMDRAGMWLQQNADQDSKLLADSVSLEVLSGRYGFDVTSYSYWIERLYLGDDWDIYTFIDKEDFTFGNYKHTFQKGKIDYLVINMDLTMLPSRVFGGVPENHTLERLDQIPLLDKVYDNGQIIIYEIDRSG